MLYRSCDNKLYSQTFATGNIEKIVANETTSTRTRKYKTGGSRYQLIPSNFNSNDPKISYPLTFILENNPIENYLLFTYTNPDPDIPDTYIHYDSCGFTPAINHDTPFTVLFAAEDAREDFNITYINIERYYKQS